LTEPRLATIPWAPPRAGHYEISEIQVDAARTALIVVDIQRGYTERTLGIGPTLEQFPAIRDYYYARLTTEVMPNILKLIDFCRQHGLEVVFSRQGYQMVDGRDVPEWNWRRGQLGQPDSRLFWAGSPEFELVPELARPDDLVVDKSSAGPFATTALDQYLRNLGVENLLVAGVLTNVAVETTARDAGDRGYNVIGVDDACAAYYADEHEDAMTSASWWVSKSTAFVLEHFGRALA
jgi:nicotinamidase-related amidase